MFYEKELYHYLILHFPIALFITGYLFDLVFFYNKDNFYSKCGFMLMGCGIITGIISIITGFITDNTLVGHMEEPFPIWTTHGTHMIVSIFIFLCLFILRYYNDKSKKLYFNKMFIVLHTLSILFFMHGAQMGAKLADRL